MNKIDRVEAILNRGYQENIAELVYNTKNNNFLYMFDGDITDYNEPTEVYDLKDLYNHVEILKVEYYSPETLDDYLEFINDMKEPELYCPSKAVLLYDSDVILDYYSEELNDYEYFKKTNMQFLKLSIEKA